MPEPGAGSRRDWLAKILMAVGLAGAYGTFGGQFLSFILPRHRNPPTRKLFAGRIEGYEVGKVRKFHDLRGAELLVKRNPDGFRAFSSVCPHLGCMVHWESDKERFFCPCHRGVFDADGNPVSGPPADAGQQLAEVPLIVDEAAGVVYIEVRDTDRRGV